MGRAKKIFFVLLKILLSTRVKSLAWGTLMMLVSGVLLAIAENIELFEFQPEMMIGIGLFLAQVSKGLNNKVQGKTAGWIAPSIK